MRDWQNSSASTILGLLHFTRRRLLTEEAATYQVTVALLMIKSKGGERHEGRLASSKEDHPADWFGVGRDKLFDSLVVINTDRTGGWPE
jgi:hypothetical protein